VSSACSPATRLPPDLREVVDRRLYFVIYGPPATGKTRIAFELAKYAIASGKEALVLATEPGTLTYARNVATCVPTKAVLSFYDMTNLVVEALSGGVLLVIDSINWPFRGYLGTYSLARLSMISAMLRRSGGVAVGQVMEVGQEEEMALGRWVIPWAHVVGKAERVRCKGGPCSRLTLLKPPGPSFTYELISNGVRWLEQPAESAH